jgi:hypothetical protein
MAKRKRTNNDLQITTQKKTKRSINTNPHKKPVVNSGRVGSSRSACGTLRVNIVTNPVISHEWGTKIRMMRVCGFMKMFYIT